MILKTNCKYCGKVLEVVASKPGKNSVLYTYRCGHSAVVTGAVHVESTTLDDGTIPYPFQNDTLKFIEKANFRALLNLDMGLGKTVITLAMLKNHPELLPAIIICKSSIKMQWFIEADNKIGEISQILRKSTDIPQLPLVIASVDLLSRAKWLDDEKILSRYKTIIIDECQTIKNHESARTNGFRKLCQRSITVKRTENPDLRERNKIKIIAEDLMKYHGIFDRFSLNFEDIGPGKLGMTECAVKGEGIIVGKITINKDHAVKDDEDKVIETILHEIAHAITPGAGHRPIWRDTAKAIGSDGEEFAKWCNGTSAFVEKIERPLNIIALSGTPIKNHAGEYFPILNILHPEIFNNREKFIREWVDFYTDAYATRMGGIQPWKLKQFKELTDPFIIRYTREEVMPDLPKIDRQVKFIEIENETVRKAYGEVLDKFLDDYEENDKLTADSMASLQRMRQIIGLAKVNDVVEMVEEFLDSDETGKSKIIIAVHHDAVRELLMKKLAPFGCVAFKAGDVSTSFVANFTRPENRCAVMSTLAGGEGIDGLQRICSTLIMMERQWNPANEEQMEARLPRKGSTADKITVFYPTVTGSIDEMLVGIVGRKRVAVNQTLSGDGSIPWDSDNILRELANELRRKGRKAWKS